jgi:response regulator RpfG family c-di-GMP phosphodiesterase
MDPITWIVLGGAVLATVWLVFYVVVYLPKQLDERFLESMKAFSTAIELRFPSHTGLTEEVASLAAQLGSRLGLSEIATRNLLMAARLRDIGLCAIPYSLVNGKPWHDWSQAEQSTYDRHPEVSGAMLELVPSLRHLAEVVRTHHADYDGSSDGSMLIAEQIPIEARILKVATEYTWYSREYGEGLAQQRILNARGEVYCPQVVDAFASVLTSSRVESPQPSLA